MPATKLTLRAGPLLQTLKHARFVEWPVPGSGGEMEEHWFEQDEVASGALRLSARGLLVNDANDFSAGWARPGLDAGECIVVRRVSAQRFELGLTGDIQLGNDGLVEQQPTFARTLGHLRLDQNARPVSASSSLLDEFLLPRTYAHMLAQSLSDNPEQLSRLLDFIAREGWTGVRARWLGVFGRQAVDKPSIRGYSPLLAFHSFANISASHLFDLGDILSPRETRVIDCQMPHNHHDQETDTMWWECTVDNTHHFCALHVPLKYCPLEQSQTSLTARLV
jgi:hypothetical protein